MTLDQKIDLEMLRADIPNRKQIMPYEIAPGMRIGLYDGNQLRVMTVGETGLARLSADACRELIVIAKIGPDQPAMYWTNDGTVSLAPIHQVPEHQTLATLYDQSPSRAPWESVNGYQIVALTQREKKAIWEETPRNQRIPPGGVLRPQDSWFYQR